MKFYFNLGENICAEEAWVVKKLCEDYPEFSAQDHIENLQSRRTWCGWYECEFYKSEVDKNDC